MAKSAVNIDGLIATIAPHLVKYISGPDVAKQPELLEVCPNYC